MVKHFGPRRQIPSECDWVFSIMHEVRFTEMKRGIRLGGCGQQRIQGRTSDGLKNAPKTSCTKVLP